MAEKIIHIKMYDGIFRIISPGYATVTQFGDSILKGTGVGLGKPMIDVIVGDKYAAVIDTGYGEYDLKAYIEKNITDKPLICFNTHGHGDHVGGDALFGEVYIGWRDIELAKSGIAGLQNRICKEVKDAGMPVFKPLYGGEIFDLGGRTLRTVPIPGHTFGGIGYIDSKCKILFSGDAVLKRIILNDVPAKFAREIFIGLKKENFAEILCGHWIWPLGRDQIDRFIHLIDIATPEMVRPIVNNFSGNIVKTSMVNVGKDFYDPDFCAISFIDSEKFFRGEFELEDKISASSASWVKRAEEINK